MAGRSNEQDFVDELWAEDDEDTRAGGSKYLLFYLGDELYGINIINVTEIIEMQRITPVPDMPDYIKGVINLRGKVIPVMDLRLRFRMQGREYDDRTCIVVTSIENASLGMIVDTVAEVHDIHTDNMEPASRMPSSAGEKYVEGIGKLDDQVCVLIDAHKILLGNDVQAIRDQL